MRCDAEVEDAKIKLVAVDLDGTLLDEQKRIAPATVRAIAGLGEREIRFVIASARPPRSVRHFYEELGLDTLQVNYNGALVWDQVKGRAVFHRPLSGELALEIIRFARAVDEDVLVTCEILDRWHTDRVDNSYTTETGRLFPPDVIAPVEEFCCQQVTKLLLLGASTLILPLEKQIQQRFGGQIGMVRTCEELLQINEPSVSKAAALAEVAKAYGISLQEVLAIGDAANDIEMLRECGVGVAVANAVPALKAVANWTAPSNSSLGVLDALTRFVYRSA